MPQIPQISGPLSGGKTLTSTGSNTGSPQNAEAFSISGVNAVQRPAGVTNKGETGATENKGAAGNHTPSIGIPVAKDPAMAVETLHDVFSGDLLENAKLNGYTELVGEIDDLTKAIYISPDKLLNEILTQEKDNTVFSGNELFDILRTVCGESGEETKELVAGLLKALNYAMSRKDIIEAVRSNIKFLAEYFGKNTTLSKNLNALYQKWMSKDPTENFESLKNETAALMRSISGSLQSDSRTETLVPLVTHNLSRYNTNEYMMKEAFSQLMSQIPSASSREALSKAFASFVSNLLMNSYNNNTTNTQENQVSNENFDISAEKASVLAYINALAEGKITGLADNNGNIAQNLKEIYGENSNGEETAENILTNEQKAENFRNSAAISDTRINYLLNNYQSESIGAKAALTQLLSLIFPENDSLALESMKNIIENTSDTDQLVNFLNDILRAMPDMPERQTLYDALETIMEDLVHSAADGATDVSAEKAAILVYLSKLSGGAESAERVLSSVISGDNNETNEQSQIEAYKNSVSLSDSHINNILNNYQSGLVNGKDAIDSLLALLIPKGNADAAEVMKTVIRGTDNLTELVDFLNRVLENMPDVPERQTLCDAFENIVDGMAHNHEMLTQNQAEYVSETMKALTSFIDRNVNHPAIRGIDNFNASNLLQSLLNAPGVFTPLAHYIIPIHVEDTRAFGELWVDNDNTASGKNTGGEKKYHLFLTFDVEAVGRFEVDAYSVGKELNLSVLYPKSYRYRVANLTDKITKIAAGVGYNVQNFKTGILFKPHSLAETFPRINENRKTFDIKA